LKKDYEKAAFKFLNNLETDGDIIVVGANEGYYAVRLAKKNMGKKVVHAFEPVEENIDALSKNIKLNNLLDYVIVNQCAVGDYVGDIEITTLPGKYSSLSSVSPMSNGSKVSVPILTLDHAFKDKNIGLIIMDVEGHELHVLRGAMKLIKSSLPVIFLEHEDSRNNQDSLNEIEECLRSLGYDLYSHVEGSTITLFSGHRNSGHNLIAIHGVN